MTERINMAIASWKFIACVVSVAFRRRIAKKRIDHLVKDQDVLMNFDFELNWKIRPIGWTFAEWMENLEKFQNTIHFGVQWWYIMFSLVEIGNYKKEITNTISNYVVPLQWYIQFKLKNVCQCDKETRKRNVQVQHKHGQSWNYDLRHIGLEVDQAWPWDRGVT